MSRISQLADRSGQPGRSRRSGVQDDRSPALGAINATLGLPGFNTFGIGQGVFGESAGGVAVGPDGRCNVVGRAGQQGLYPVTGGGRNADQNVDAARTELDMVPPSPLGAGGGVGRTDGTGFTAGSAFPLTLPTPFTGGTTPYCALNEFGTRIGEAPPLLQRMLIDLEGDLTLPPGSTNTAILIDRPNPQAGTVMIGVLEIGPTPAAPWVVIGGLTELWLGGGAYVLFPTATTVDQAYRLPLSPLAGLGPVSAQLTCLLAAPVGGGACVFLWTASPALWFSY